MLIIDLHNVNYAVARMDKRFKVYEFIADNHLYPQFISWFINHPARSRYNAMIRFVVHLKRMDELKCPKYDRQDPLNLIDLTRGVKPLCDMTPGEYNAIVHAKWLD